MDAQAYEQKPLQDLDVADTVDGKSQLKPDSSIAPSDHGKQQWSRKRGEAIASFCLFAVLGMNDSATGANLPAMQAHYGLSYVQISNVFLAYVAGYFFSCLFCEMISKRLGVRYALVMSQAGGGGMMVGCLLLSFTPPFSVFVIGLLLQGFATGLCDSLLTTLVSQENDSASMSFLYAAFGVGAMGSPLIIGAFVDSTINWNYYYFIPLGLTLVLTPLVFFIFSTYEPPKAGEVEESHIMNTHELEMGAPQGSAPSVLRRLFSRLALLLRQRAVWTGFPLIFLAYAYLTPKHKT
ncbi:hypothetical protein P7C70_g4796, partial [Phenoliferia sp. Uapishka_3]